MSRNQIPRDFAAQLGEEAVRIGNQGFYTSPSGTRVDIEAEMVSAVKGTRSYPPDALLPRENHGPHKTKISVNNETTLSAARRFMAQGLNTVVLNFASASSPGGGFLSGARAQEEYLARSSGLYHCIRDNSMYRLYRDGLEPLYSDRLTSFFMIYSPKVPVIRSDDGLLLEKPDWVSIITAAAVNANRVPTNRMHEVLGVMWSRILKVLALGLAQGHDAIVLGAWGCGAFGLDAEEISKLFRRGLEENFRGAYKEVAFAILDWSPEKRFIGPFERKFQDFSR